MANADSNGGDRTAVDPLLQVVHELGNTLNALSLHLHALAVTELGAPDRGHVKAAHRLAAQSASLLAEVRRLREAGADRPRTRLTPYRNPR